MWVDDLGVVGVRCYYVGFVFHLAVGECGVVFDYEHLFVFDQGWVVDGYLVVGLDDCCLRVDLVDCVYQRFDLLG